MANFNIQIGLAYFFFPCHTPQGVSFETLPANNFPIDILPVPFSLLPGGTDSIEVVGSLQQSLWREGHMLGHARSHLPRWCTVPV